MKTQIKIHNFIKFLLISLFFSFLFLNVSHAQAATLYYNNAAADGDWNTLASWWTDDVEFTLPASALPGLSDDVVITQSVFSNSGPAISVNTITINDATFYPSLTVSNGATFNGSSINQGNTITGNAIFNGTSKNFKNKIITGNAIFNDTSLNYGGIISGDATFNDSSSNSQHVQIIFHGAILTPGVVSGNATFNDLSFNIGNVSLDATFNNSTYNDGAITGNAIFNYAHAGIITIANGGHWGSGTAGALLGDDSLPIVSWIFNGDSYNTAEIISSNVTFNGTSYNLSTITGDAIFNNSSFNQGGSISGNSTFNNWSYNNGYVYGNATFNHATGGVLSLIGSAVWGHVAGTVKDGDGVTLTELIFNDSSQTIAGADFTGNAVFYDTSVNFSTITGDACFALTATNAGTVTGVTSECSILLPLVATQTTTLLTRTSATLNGDILSTGGEFPSERGFDYGSDPTLAIVIGTVSDIVGQPFTAGSFSADITDLTCGTTYYARAYAINSINTGFGAIVPFVTASCPSYTLSYVSDSNGTITGDGTQTVFEGEDGTEVTATPNSDYHFSSWSDGVLTASRTDTNVLGDISVTANFEVNRYTPSSIGSVPRPLVTICNIGDKFSTTTGLPCTSYFPKLAPSCSITITLRFGSRGAQVKCLQTGFNILSDGIFGPQTKASVVAFQKSKNLVPDGIFGPKSRAIWNK